jgi:catechol 2,3-dioxygenase-like lactoylglutathione lyase family enzyme
MWVCFNLCYDIAMKQQLNYRPHHTAISVRNLGNSLEFYMSLGYEQVHRYDEEDGSMSIVHLKLSSSFLEIFAYKKNENVKRVDYDYANNLEDIGVKHIALSTDDIEAALADMKAKGYANDDIKITFGRTKVSYFFIQDPDGVWVEFVKDDRYK